VVNGGCQAFQWGVQYPDMMEAIAPMCCSARTANYNKVFLLALRRALLLDPVFAEGFYTRPPLAGLKAFAAIYAGWGFSEPFFRTRAIASSAPRRQRNSCSISGARIHPFRRQRSSDLVAFLG